MAERMVRWSVSGLCLLAFALRVPGLAFQSLWRDEVDAIRFASQPWRELLAMFTGPGENGPLYFLLLRPWLSLAGQSEFALRYLSVTCGVLAVPLLYRLARQLFPGQRSVALLGALLAATSPYLVWYSQEGKMYALIVVLALLSMSLFLSAVARGGWHRWLAYTVVTAMAFYVHLLAVLLIPVQMVAFVLRSAGSDNVRWRPWLASLAVLGLPYLPLLVWQLELLLVRAPSGFRFVPLHEILLSLWGTFSLGVAQDTGRWLGLPFVSALLAAVLLWKEHRSLPATLWTLLAWLLLPVLLLFLITLAFPLYTARYLIFVLPAYLLLLAAGLAAIWRRTSWLAAVVLLAVLVLNARGIWLQARTPIKADFRAATEYVMNRASAGDLVLFQIPYGRYSFEYYARRGRAARVEEQQLAPGFPAVGEKLHRAFIPWLAASEAFSYRWAEGLYTNGGMDPAQVSQNMTRLVSPSGTVWLVRTEAALWDERGLVQSWLADAAVLTDEFHATRVSVFHYEFP